MVRTLATLIAAGVALLAAASAGAADPPKQFDRKYAEENLRKAQAAAASTDTALEWVSRAAWVGVILKGTPEWLAAPEVLSKVRDAVAELRKGTDKLAELAERKEDRPALEAQSKTFLDKVKLVSPDKQAEELYRFDRNVKDLPVGLVSDRVDDKFKVTVDLLLDDPKGAEARFKAYLGAMQTNIKFLNDTQKALENASTNAKAAQQVVSKLQEGIEKLFKFFPAAGASPLGKALGEAYFDIDKLSKAYNEVATDCAARAKLAKQAAEVQNRRRDNLKVTIKTVFGFEG
jgi:hypothetical protein